MRRKTWAGALAAGLTCLVLTGVEWIAGPAETPAVAAQASAHVPALVSDPSSLVDPIDGTGTGPVSPGAVGEFPGADVPFGMIQWSPDTTPNLAGAGGGYSYADSHISGFSLTHLSGTGCASYGDVPILPTVGPIGSNPEDASASFSHSTERAAPGRYGVTLGPSKIATKLAVTTRTGLSTFTFPRSEDANVLFKVAGSANPVSDSSVHIVGRDQISGQVTSGQFCGTGTNYTLYFDAHFSRPFASSGSWSGSAVSPGSTSCKGAACGAFVTFNTETNRIVLMKVGISFVSVRNAADNLKAEDPGWSLSHVESLATNKWNALLDRIRVGGGSRAQKRTFYTALYHSLLFPNVVSDHNGQYTGADGRIHRSSHRAQYANFSEWDIYRSEIELVSLLAPHRAGDMVQSLVNDSEQGGWLPKWAIVDGDASQMNGDSADPIIAAAYAFGVRDFDVKAALKAMVKGATQTETGHGLEIERQYLNQYLTQHYVNADSLDLTSIDYSIGGSVTLEYAVDDFSIAQIASARGDHSLYESMMQRAHNWEYLFNPATGYIQARNAAGIFPAGPAFQTSMLEPGGQLGFEEGNAIQYTWSVPQDLSALSSLMGGDAQAVKKLNSFFTLLNVGRDLPFDWAGNEPSLWTPWEYDYFGAPSKTQQIVRRIADDLYSDTPANEPGNDDLGAISSWYVWAAIGMYPVTPGTANLVLASPLFPRVSIALPDHRHIVMHAAAASKLTPYIHSLKISGVALPRSTPSCVARTTSRSKSTTWNQPWLPSSIIKTGGTLTYALSSVPDPSWGSDLAQSPPSFGTGRLPAVGFSVPSGSVSLRAGQTTTIQLGIEPAGTGSSTVHWSAGSSGLTMSPAGGLFVLANPAAQTGGRSLARCSLSAPATQTLTIGATTPGSYVLEVHLETTGGTALPPVAIDVQVTD
jgi:predicted alpha-1,2-mannosidase